MSYVELRMTAPAWLTSDTITVYRDDADEISPGRMRQALNEIQAIADGEDVDIELFTICHHHLDNVSCNRDCHQNEESNWFLPSYKYTKGNRNV